MATTATAGSTIVIQGETLRSFSYSESMLFISENYILSIQPGIITMTSVKEADEIQVMVNGQVAKSLCTALPLLPRILCCGLLFTTGRWC